MRLVLFFASWEILFQVYASAVGDLQSKLKADNPSAVWIVMDGWSAVTTSYLGLEICT